MKKIALGLLFISCMMLCACGYYENKTNENKFNIVTSFYPMYIATSNIVDGVQDVTLSNMTDVQVGCLHDYQMTTKDMNKLEKADAFIINGGGMESFLDKATSSFQNLKVINASAGILEECELEEHEHDFEHTHEHDENAHVWVSISLYMKQVQNIADGLSKIDVKNASTYQENAKNYIDKLKILKSEMHEKLEGLQKKNIVTFHEAFSYFAEEFDLNIVAVIEREPGTSPSAGQLAKIIDEIKETSASAIFVEPQHEKTVANVISKETNVPVYSLDPIVSGKFDKGEYEKIMKENLKVLEEALKSEE